jgi:hypothetical protein
MKVSISQPEAGVNGLNAEIALLEQLSGECPALAAILKQLTKTLEEIQAQAETAIPKEKVSDPNNGPVTPTLCANMGEMMAILTQLEFIISQLAQNRAKVDSNVDDDFLQMMQSNLQQAKHQYTKLIHEEKKEAFWSTFLKVTEGIVAALVTVIALACGQPELAIMVIALAAASLSGGFGKATDLVGDALQKCDLSKLFQSMGMSKEEADKAVKVVASAVIIAATIALTMATCGAAAPEAIVNITDESMETSMEMVDMSENTIASSGATTAETTESTNPVARALNWIKENNPLNKLSKGTNLSIISGSQAFMQTNFLNNLIDASAPHMDAEKKARLEKILNIIISVVFSLLSVFAGMGAFNTASTISTESTIGRTLARFQGAFVKTPGLMNSLQLGLAGAMSLQAVGQGMVASSQFRLAGIQLDIGDYKALQELLQGMISSVSSDARANTKNQTDLLAAHTRAIDESMIAFAKSQQAIAQQMA